jgi:hypothetical protein
LEGDDGQERRWEAAKTLLESRVANKRWTGQDTGEGGKMDRRRGGVRKKKLWLEHLQQRLVYLGHIIYFRDSSVKYRAKKITPSSSHDPNHVFMKEIILLENKRLKKR